jgi:hypothetical protein
MRDTSLMSGSLALGAAVIKGFRRVRSCAHIVNAGGAMTHTLQRRGRELPDDFHVRLRRGGVGLREAHGRFAHLMASVPTMGTSSNARTKLLQVASATMSYPFSIVGRMKRLRRITPDDVIRGRLFFVSYVPLCAIAAVRALPRRIVFHGGHLAYGSLAWFLLACWGLFDGRNLIAGSRKKGVTRQAFTDIRNQGNAVSGYLATYLLTFIASPLEGWRTVLVYLFYFMVALVVFVRSDMALVNPTMYLYGYSAYAAKLTDGAGHIVGGDVVVLCRNSRALKGSTEVHGIAEFYVVKE